MDRDPASAAAEYLAEFRTDIESFIAREAIEFCVAPGVIEQRPASDVRYSAFVDPSGGASDSFTLAIAHRDGDSLFLDATREVRPPFSPESVISEFAALCKSYRVHKVTGDRYGGEFPREQFRKYGISYEVSQKPKSDIYRDILPLLNSRRVMLLDQPRLIQQLAGLERRTARSGRDSIDHASTPGAHDDLANSACGALLMAQLANRQRLRMGFASADGFGPITEIDPITYQPLGQRRSHLVRDANGNLRLVGGDNNCCSSERDRRF